jgi:hypothetical protein
MCWHGSTNTEGNYRSYPDRSPAGEKKIHPPTASDSPPKMCLFFVVCSVFGSTTVKLSFYQILKQPFAYNMYPNCRSKNEDPKAHGKGAGRRTSLSKGRKVNKIRPNKMFSFFLCRFILPCMHYTIYLTACLCVPGSKQLQTKLLLSTCYANCNIACLDDAIYLHNYMLYMKSPQLLDVLLPFAYAP